MLVLALQRVVVVDRSIAPLHVFTPAETSNTPPVKTIVYATVGAGVVSLLLVAAVVVWKRRRARLQWLRRSTKSSQVRRPPFTDGLPCPVRAATVLPGLCVLQDTRSNLRSMRLLRGSILRRGGSLSSALVTPAKAGARAGRVNGAARAQMNPIFSARAIGDQRSTASLFSSARVPVGSPNTANTPATHVNQHALLAPYAGSVANRRRPTSVQRTRGVFAPVHTTRQMDAV